MRKIILLTAAVVYVLFAVSLFTSAQRERNGGNIQVSGNMQKDSVESIEDYLYILTVEDGVIVVKNEKNETVKKTDSLVSLLPHQDRKSLEMGIKVYSEKELSGLLEDFCS